MKIVALAGGVGGARMVDGLAQVVPPQDLTVVVNTGDDFEHLGLYICPDLDTVTYTLGGLANSEMGWGRAGESWSALETLGKLGGPDWFRLGDLDLGLHLERTRRLREGQPLSQITLHFCQVLGIETIILPMSDDPVPTWVDTKEGELPFQEYFVHQRCEPQVIGFRFEGVEASRPAPGVVEALDAADLVVICPSNPWVSVDPILAVPGLRGAIRAPVLAISPIIGGQTVKGPAAKMYAELGIQPSALAVAKHYDDLLDGFVIDQVDADQASVIQAAAIPAAGVKVLTTHTWMKTSEDRVRLARELISFNNEKLLSREID